MDFVEKTVSQEYIFHGHIMTVRVDQATLPNGKPCTREVCEHPGGVGILPLDADGNVTLVRQYRYPYGEVILEIPAGKMDQGPEGHLACGIREPAEVRPIAPADIGVWIVPGLAFTRAGGRLGYGGGWYDRLLGEAAPGAVALGVAHAFQIVDALPVEPHDRTLSGVVSV